MHNNLLSVVIPIFNEEEALPLLIPSLVDFCQNRNWCLILVNDSSADNSIAILTEYENIPSVVGHHRINHDYGGKFKTGISKVSTDFTVTMVADGQHDPEDIEVMFNLVKEE